MTHHLRHPGSDAHRRVTGAPRARAAAAVALASLAALVSQARGAAAALASVALAATAWSAPAGASEHAPNAASAASTAASTAAPTATAAPRPVGVHLAEPRLAGEGPMRWFGLRIYDARLWVSAGRFDVERLRQSEFALELRYARSLAGQAIAAASRDEIARLGFGTPEQRGAWFDAMARLFPDVGAGDRLTGVHRPGAGVSFYRGDRPIGSVDDPEFGQAFFAIWLHPKTAAPDLRAALLGRAGPAGAGTR